MKSEDTGRTGPVIITGHGNVVGDNSSSHTNIHMTGQRADALAALDEFIRKLPAYENSISDGRRVWDDAMAARMELAKPTPKWDRVKAILKSVAGSVAGIAALSDLVNNALSIIAHF